MFSCSKRQKLVAILALNVSIIASSLLPTLSGTVLATETEPPQFEFVPRTEKIDLSQDKKVRYRIIDVNDQFGSVTRSYFEDHIEYDYLTNTLTTTLLDHNKTPLSNSTRIDGRRYDVSVQILRAGDEPSKPTTTLDTVKTPWFFDNKDKKELWDKLSAKSMQKLDNSNKKYDCYLLGQIPPGTSFDIGNIDQLKGEANITDWQPNEKERTYEYCFAEIEKDPIRGDYLHLEPLKVTIKNDSDAMPEFPELSSDVTVNNGMSEDKDGSKVRYRIIDVYDELRNSARGYFQNNLSYSAKKNKLTTTLLDRNITPLSNNEKIVGLRYDVKVEVLSKKEPQVKTVYTGKTPWFFDHQDIKDLWDALSEKQALAKWDKTGSPNEEYLLLGSLPDGVVFNSKTSQLLGVPKVTDWQEGENERIFNCYLATISLYGKNAGNSSGPFDSDELRIKDLSIIVKRNQGNEETGSYTDGWDRVDYFVTRTTKGQKATANLHFIKEDNGKDIDVTEAIKGRLKPTKEVEFTKVLRLRAGRTELVTLAQPMILHSDYSVTFIPPEDAKIGDTYTIPGGDEKNKLPAVLTKDTCDSLTTEMGITVHFKLNQQCACCCNVVFTNANFDIVGEIKPEPTKPEPTKPIIEYVPNLPTETSTTDKPIVAKTGETPFALGSLTLIAIAMAVITLKSQE